MRVIRELLGDPDIPKVAHNAKFDWKMANHSGVIIRGIVHDTMLMASLVNENEESHSLAYLAGKYLGFDNKWEGALNDWFRKNCYRLRKQFGDNWKRYDQVPWEIMKHYASGDVVQGLKLLFLFSGPIEADYQAIYEQELRFLPQLIRIEDRGHKIDPLYFRRLRMRSPRKLKKMMRQLWDIAGEQFNPNAPMQVAAIFKGLGMESTEKTKKGNESWGKDVLAGIDHPLARGLLAYRQLAKLSSTYYGPLANRGEECEIIHATFWQTGSKKGRSVRTGRLSSSDPNFQNIPRKDKSVRRGFVCRPGYRIYYWDYKQIEMVIFAHMSGDRRLLAAVRRGEDLHAATAALLFGDGYRNASTDTKAELRQVAKTINFGIIYGMGVKKLAQSLRELLVDVSPEAKAAADMPLGSIDDGTAKGILKSYHRRLPTVGEFSRHCMFEIGRVGFVQDVFGRRYHVPVDLRYKAPNAVIQGCASNVMKRGIIRVGEQVLKNTKSGIVNDVHDEIAVEIHHSERRLVPLITKALEDHSTFSVPIRVDLAMTKTNWAEKTKI